jgi:hypothetical protein
MDFIEVSEELWYSIFGTGVSMTKVGTEMCFRGSSEGQGPLRNMSQTFLIETIFLFIPLNLTQWIEVQC